MRYSPERSVAAGATITSAMTLASSLGFDFTVGLLVTFLGIGVLVNILIVYIAVQISAERQENRFIEQEYVTDA